MAYGTITRTTRERSALSFPVLTFSPECRAVRRSDRISRWVIENAIGSVFPGQIRRPSRTSQDIEKLQSLPIYLKTAFSAFCAGAEAFLNKAVAVTMKGLMKAVKGTVRSSSRRALGMALSLLASDAMAARGPTSRVGAATSVQVGSIPEVAKFTDVTSTLGLRFEYVASHTSKKYLIEAMGAGAALFDYDNDRRLDIFVVNGAPLNDPTPKGTVPQKTGPKDWNRLYHQMSDGTFEDVTQSAGLQGVGYGMGVAVGDYDNDGFEDLYVTAYGGNKLYHNNGDGTFTDGHLPM